MRSTCTTAQGLSTLIGLVGSYSVDPFKFPVKVRAAKIERGHIKLFVMPLGNSAERVALRGDCWVDASKVRLTLTP